MDKANDSEKLAELTQELMQPLTVIKGRCKHIAGRRR